jgi:HAD superfamily hydrolase (TIGR01509 family)
MPAPDERGLRAIFFDAGNTLVRMNYAAIAAQLGALGHAVTPEAVQGAEWRARVRLDDDVFARPGTSTESAAARASYLELLLRELSVTDDATVHAMTAWRRDYNAPVGIFDAVDPEGEAAVALARAAGLQVAVISNSNGTARALLGSLGLGRHLDFVIDSFEVGVEKPDARIFALALERARVEPHEAIYVGDLYSVDVCGARGAGMDGILLDPGGHWGRRDCRRAPGPLAAVRLVLAASPAPPIESHRGERTAAPPDDPPSGPN